MKLNFSITGQEKNHITSKNLREACKAKTGGRSKKEL